MAIVNLSDQMKAQIILPSVRATTVEPYHPIVRELVIWSMFKDGLMPSEVAEEDLYDVARLIVKLETIATES